MKILLSNTLFSILFLRVFPPVIQFIYLNIIILALISPIYKDLSTGTITGITVVLSIYFLLCFLVAYFHLLDFINKKNRYKEVVKFSNTRDKINSLKELLLDTTCDMHQVKHNFRVLYRLKNLDLNVEEEYLTKDLITVYKNYMDAPKYKENSLIRKIITFQEMNPVKHLKLLNFTTQYILEDLIYELQIIDTYGFNKRDV